MQEGPQLLGTLARERRRAHPMGPRGAGREASHTLRAEAPDGLARRLLRAADGLGDLRHTLAAHAGEHDLAASQHHYLRRA